MFSRSSIALLLTVWASLASGQTAEPGCQSKLEAEQVLGYLNAFRAQDRVCGERSFAAAGPLRWQAQLEQAALGHAAELAQGEALNHLSLSGRTLRERVRAQGYLAYRVGENLAAGQESVDEVLRTWSSSAKHCENIMQPAFHDVAMVCAKGAGKYGSYWVMNLGHSVRD